MKADIVSIVIYYLLADASWQVQGFIPHLYHTTHSNRASSIAATSKLPLLVTSDTSTCKVGDPPHQVLDRRSFLTASTALVMVSAPPLTANADDDANTNTNTNSIPEWTLEQGVLKRVQMPTLALNTVGLSVDDTEKAVRYARKAGIVHIDFHPGKERDGVAQYIAKEGREGLFLNTKIRKAPPGTSPSDAAERTRVQIEEDLKALGVDSVDMLMLRDSPDCEVIQAQWAVLEEALTSGKTRSLGVINFCESALTCVLQKAKIKPALNYYMLHIGIGKDAHGLRTFGESRGIKTFAYGAVGEPGPSEELLQSLTLKKIATAHQKTPEEVALRWVTQGGSAVSVRPTLNFGLGTGICADPDCETGIQARASSFQWSLSKKEMAILDAMKSPDQNPTLFSSSGCPNAFVMPK